ncbi:hypothetical protein N181_31105 [Sinorhizobium fredii USDA 205]|nr:hypothetical protein N181_31105 [Sinorhizobium fredii USDA 205]CCE98996.1 hypothetical protein SFHH103_04520 [Sinorhizobium fredii HH103]CEO91315.1 hypothetical protein SFHH103_psfHH103d_119 [Sinorhizobium fredii HH103]
MDNRILVHAEPMMLSTGNPFFEPQSGFNASTLELF